MEKKPHIDYPRWWDYTIIGTDEEDLRLAAGEIAKGLQHKVAFSKLSATKKYASLNVDIYVATEEERNRLFEAFKSHPAVKYLL